MSITNTAGKLKDKSNIALETGRQWDVFSPGPALGKTTLSPVHGRDTGNYIEVRPNLNKASASNGSFLRIPVAFFTDTPGGALLKTKR